jgi:hypothetical protein
VIKKEESEKQGAVTRKKRSACGRQRWRGVNEDFAGRKVGQNPGNCRRAYREKLMIR